MNSDMWEQPLQKIVLQDATGVGRGWGAGARLELMHLFTSGCLFTA